MTKINGHAYPLHDDVREQNKHYEYFLRKDLEELLRRDREEDAEYEQGELELEDA